MMANHFDWWLENDDRPLLSRCGLTGIYLNGNGGAMNDTRDV
jgi:hypothetical protein